MCLQQVDRLPQARENGQYTGGQGYHSEGIQQAGEMGWQPHCSSTKANAGTDWPHTTALARHCLPGEPRCRNRHEVLIDKEGHESTVQPCSNEGKSNTGLQVLARAVLALYSTLVRLNPVLNTVPHIGRTIERLATIEILTNCRVQQQGHSDGYETGAYNMQAETESWICSVWKTEE